MNSEVHFCIHKSPTLHTQLYLNVALTRRTKERIVGTILKAQLFRKSWKIGLKCTYTQVLKVNEAENLLIKEGQETLRDGNQYRIFFLARNMLECVLMENRSETMKNYGSYQRTLITDIPVNSRVGEVVAEARRTFNRQDTSTLRTVKHGINQLLFFSPAPLCLRVFIYLGTSPEHINTVHDLTPCFFTMTSRILTTPPMGPLAKRLIQTSDEPYTPNACNILRPSYPKSQTRRRNIHIQNQPSAQTVGSSTM